MARRLARLLTLALLPTPPVAAQNATGHGRCSPHSACDEDEADAALESAALLQSSSSPPSHYSFGAHSDYDDEDAAPEAAALASTVLLLQSKYALTGSSAALEPRAPPEHRHEAHRTTAEGRHRDRRKRAKLISVDALLRRARGLAELALDALGDLAVRVAVAAGAGRASPRPTWRSADRSVLGTASFRSSTMAGTSSFLMIPLGIALLFFSFPVLWANERKAARYESLVQLAALDCTGLRPSAAVKVDNRGRLVHVAGAPAKGVAPVQDRRVPELKIESGALRLRSTVEQYQEYEVQVKQSGGSSGSHGGSSHGGSHGGSHGTFASHGGVGQSQAQSAPKTERVRTWSALALGGTQSGPIDKLLGQGGSSLQLGVETTTCSAIAVGDALLLPPDLSVQLDAWQDARSKIGTSLGDFKRGPSDQYYYKASTDPSSPQVGDQRIKIEYIPNATVSIIGLQCDVVDANTAVRRAKPESRERPSIFSAGDEEPEPEAEWDAAPMTGPAVWADWADGGRDSLLPWRLVRRGFGCCAVGEEELKRRLIAAGQSDPQELLDEERCGCGPLERCCCIGCCVSIVNAINTVLSAVTFPQVYGVCHGSVSADKMLQQIKQLAGMQTWLFRFLGWALMMVGFMMIFSPITSLLDLIPLVGSFLSTAVTLVVFIAAFVLTLTISTLVVAVAYLLYRPFVGVAYLLLAGAVVAGTIYLQSVLASS